MKKIRLILACLLMPWYAFAWHGNGHMTAGAIAYYYLKTNNPVALQKILTTLRQHPWCAQKRWRDTLASLPTNQQEVGLFMLASTFPDDAKQVPGAVDGDAEHKLWHYIDLPFVPSGQSISPLPPKTPNAELKINDLLRALPQETNSPQKATDLAWLFHLIEDIHQPLHTASLFDTGHPSGDDGGNATYLRINGKAKLVLHSYWDDLVKGQLTQYAVNAQNLLKNPKYRENALTELTTNTTPGDWIHKESFPNAKTAAYLNGAVVGTEAKPSAVTTDYDTKASALAERRVVLAGIRLAKLLTQVYKS